LWLVVVEQQEVVPVLPEVEGAEEKHYIEYRSLVEQTQLLPLSLEQLVRVVVLVILE
jgi:hypothetical protein